MGRDNWRPYQNSELYDLRYFDLYERYEVSDPDDWDQFLWDQFRDEIFMALPDSFWEVEGGESVSVPYADFRMDNRIIFRNELVCIMMDGSAEAGHVGVAMVRLTNDDLYQTETWKDNFTQQYLDRCAEPFWKRLGGEQRVRTSAWTSAKVG